MSHISNLCYNFLWKTTLKLANEPVRKALFNLGSIILIVRGLRISSLSFQIFIFPSAIFLCFPRSHSVSSRNAHFRRNSTDFVWCMASSEFDKLLVIHKWKSKINWPLNKSSILNSDTFNYTAQLPKSFNSKRCISIPANKFCLIGILNKYFVHFLKVFFQGSLSKI